MTSSGPVLGDRRRATCSGEDVRVERAAYALALEEVVATVEAADGALVEDRGVDGGRADAVTPTPWAAASERSASDSPTTACLVMTYDVSRPAAISPPIDAVLTMWPAALAGP